MRLAALASTVLLSGCAILFQERLQTDYKPVKHGPPQCSTSAGWQVLDGLFFVGNIVGIVAIRQDVELSQDARSTIAIGNVVEALVHTLSGYAGSTWVDECKDARRDYAIYVEKARARQRADRQAARAVAPVAQERRATYFCTVNPADTTIGECKLTRGNCEVAQARIVAQGLDTGPCIEAPAAVCYASERDGGRVTRCAPTRGSCERQRLEAGVDGAVSACSDVAADEEVPRLPLERLPAPVVEPVPPPVAP